MAKTSLSDLQMNRVNELALDIWNLILAIKPAQNELPEFLRNLEGKGEYAVKNAIDSALRAIYIPNSKHAENFESLLGFLIARHEYYRHLILAGSTSKLDGKFFVELCAIEIRIGEMGTEKLVHAPKTKK